MTNDVAVVDGADDSDERRKGARKQAVVFLLLLFTSSWLCVLDDGRDRAAARAKAPSHPVPSAHDPARGR